MQLTNQYTAECVARIISTAWHELLGSYANQPTSSFLLRSYSSRYLDRTLSSFPEPWDTITLRSLSWLEVFACWGIL